jgi:large subunit ribosomal protein L10
MSKFVKDLITDHIRNRLTGMEHALLVNLSALDGVTNNRLRMELQKEKVGLMVVKNSLARRATEGTPLAAAFAQAEGSLAVLWGGEDIVSLAKTLTKLSENKEFQKLETRGGVLDGARLSAEDVKDVAKWPTRQEQLSLLLGQILSPGAKLSSQLLGPGGMLASQVDKKSEGADEEPAAAAEAAPAAE